MMANTAHRASTVCIAGMHRSGTSMVARLIFDCGVYPGAPEELLPPQPDNPKGYFEHKGMLALNEALLEHLGGAWDFPPEPAVGWESAAELEGLRKQAAELIAGFRGHEPWGWKDPRNALTLPFWRSLIPDLKVVVCLRNPMEVAASLQKRGYSSRRFSLRLWETYNRMLLRSVSPRRRIVVRHDRVLANPEKELKRILRFLGLSVPHETVDRACESVDLDLYHHREVDPGWEDLPVEVLSLYLDLCLESSQNGSFHRGEETQSFSPESGFSEASFVATPRPVGERAAERSRRVRRASAEPARRPASEAESAFAEAGSEPSSALVCETEMEQGTDFSPSLLEIEDPAVLARVGRVMMRREKPEAARRFLVRALKLVISEKDRHSDNDSAAAFSEGSSAGFETDLGAARQAMQRGDAGKAKEILEALLEKNPRNPQAHHLLGQAAAALKDTERAKAHLQAALEIGRDNPVFLLDYADFVAVEFGRVEEAIDIYHRLLARNPTDIDVLLRLGTLYAVCKSFEEGRFVYARVLALAPDHPQAVENVRYLDEMAGPDGSPVAEDPIFSRHGETPMTARSRIMSRLYELKLHCFFHERNEQRVNPLVAPDLKRPERFCAWFELSDLPSPASFRLDLPPSTGAVRIVRLVLERATRPPLDLTRCLVSTGKSFGGLRYYFDSESSHFAFSPLPEEEIRDAKRLQAVLDYAPYGPASQRACLQEMERLQDAVQQGSSLIAKQKEKIASYEKALREAQEALQQMLRATSSRSPAPPANPTAPQMISSIPPLRRQPGKIAVHVHLYYLDMLEEMASRLSRMPFAYDAVFTVTQPEAALEVEQEVLRRGGSNLGKLRVQVVPNRGRDIAALFHALGPVYRQYDYIAHVHTKKSLYSGSEKRSWRDYLLQSLFCDETHIRRIFALFESHSEIGLVYPETAKEMPYWCHSWLSNQRSAAELFGRLRIGFDTSLYIDYPVGSMFWARSKALAPLFELGLKFEDFPGEPAPNDGTLAHAIERSFCIAAHLQKMTFAVLDLPRNRFAIGCGGKNLESYWAQSLPHLFDALRPFRRISFDVFDTLITRPALDPDHVFWLMEKRLLADFMLDVDFLHLRKQAELHARQKKRGDVSLDEIYESMKAIGGLSEVQAEKIRRLEIETEARFCRAREGMPELITRLLGEGKELTYLSDMYLPSREIQALLARCGIPTDSCRILVSCETGKRKDDGGVWKRFREEIADVHVGDNEHADVQMAVDHGVPCYHVMSPRRLAELGTPRLLPPQWRQPHASIFAGPVWERMFSSPFALHRSRGKVVIDDPRDMGYACLGPLLLYFTLWLYDLSRKRNIRHLLFLAREGYLLQELFQIAESALGETGIRKTYLLCSRRAVSVPTLSGDRDILELLDAPYRGSYESLLVSRFGVEPLETEGLPAGQEQLLREAVVRLPEDRNRISNELLRIKKRILENAERERSTYLQYLKKNAAIGSEACAVVDIGFSGTIQKYLARLTGKAMEGFYFVTSERARNHPLAERMHGCFGSFLKPKSGNPVYDYSLILESVLTAPQGQLLRFDPGGNPVFAEHVYKENQWPIVRAVHLGIIDYVRQTIGWYKEALPEFESAKDTAVFFFRQIAENPNVISPSLREILKVDDAYVSGGVRSSFHYAGAGTGKDGGAPAHRVFLTNYLAKRSAEDDRRFRSKEEFEHYFQQIRYTYEERLLAEKILSLQAAKAGRLECQGWCDGCESKATFHSDWSFSEYSLRHQAYLFNAAVYRDWYGRVLLFRDQLICERCRLNNRQRGVIFTAKRLGLNPADMKVYVYEQTTPFYKTLLKINPRLSGSEYLGPDVPKGAIVNGVRHEDAMELTYPSDSFDLLISNDVFEHVPDLQASLREARRVLKPGGVLIFSIPFDLSKEESRVRAVLRNGALEHLEEPEYHGNPLSEKGSLVFTDCGWDVIDRCREAGFTDASMFYYYSPGHALIGGGLQFAFVGIK